MSHYSSLSTWINVVESLLEEIGYDSKKILIDNFNEEIIYGGRSKVETIGKAWRLLAEKSNKPAIGIIAAEKYFQPTNWNALGLAVLCSSTLREAMNRIMNLGDVVSDVTTITIIKKSSSLSSTTLLLAVMLLTKPLGVVKVENFNEGTSMPKRGSVPFWGSRDFPL